jgi:hypothetical protein
MLLFCWYSSSGNPKKFCEFTFPVFDKNKNDKIDFTEFMTAIALTHPGNLETRLHLVCNEVIYRNEILSLCLGFLCL